MPSYPAMTSPFTTDSLPNPYTPMAFLPKDDAIKYTIQTYFSIGSLGALVWDIIIHLPQDFKLATQSRINIPFIVYCISRISSLAYLLAVVVASTAPIGDCSMVQKVNFIYPVAIPSTLLLFVFRVCALYRNRKSAIAFFSLLWIALLGCSIAMPFGISAYKIASTGYCIEFKTGYAYTLVDLSPFVLDTIIFFATSWAFICNSCREMSLKNGLKVLIFASFLPAFSRSILRDGQLYYLTILLLNLVVIISYQLHNPWLSSCTFGFPLFVLMSTLAAHIYRNVRLKVYMDDAITSSVVNRNLRRMTPGAGFLSPPPNSMLRRSEIVFQRSGTTTTTTTTTTEAAGPRRHSSPSIKEITSPQGGVAADMEKRGGDEV